jgi:hypothetical protein
MTPDQLQALLGTFIEAASFQQTTAANVKDTTAAATAAAQQDSDAKVKVATAKGALIDAINSFPPVA